MLAFSEPALESGKASNGRQAVGLLLTKAAGQLSALIIAFKVSMARSQKLPLIQLTQRLSESKTCSKSLGEVHPSHSMSADQDTPHPR